MRKLELLLDTNIVLDFLNHRNPFYEDARLLMIAGRVGEFTLWIASSQISDIVYVATDGGRKDRIPQVLEQMRMLRSIVNVLPVTESDVDKMLATTWSDPEDVLLFDIALKAHVDAVITRDEDFKKAVEKAGIDAIEVFDCSEFFDWLKAEHDVSYAEIPL